MKHAAAVAAALLVGAASASKRVDGKINVHLVPHTHDDVGWLKTPVQYFYGANNTIQHANVESIIDTSIAALLANPERKWIYVEQAFWNMWWDKQTPNMQESVRQLVANGQLEFINGGWSMHDEACPTFVDMFDNTHVGQRVIYQNFGVVPKTTWQGSLLASPLSGANGMYVARMDYQDIAQRKLTKATEMFWAPSPSQPMQGGVLGFLPFWYYAPSGFNFGGDDGTQPVIDCGGCPEDNTADVLARFEALVAQQVGFTAGNDVMLMMATDFSMENAFTWFRNIDRLIALVNANSSNLNVFYSTPSIYTAAKASSTALPLRTEDVMPYSDDGACPCGIRTHAFWSGYFSSRPALKGYIRDSSAVFQVAKQLQAATAPPADMSPANPLFLLERAVAVNQHHDAVSGTSKQHVAYEYARLLAEGRLDADAAISDALAALTGYNSAPFAPCDLRNATICPPLEAGQPALVVVYNPLSTGAADVPVRLPVGLPAGVATYAVLNASGGALPAQLVPLSDADAALRTQYYGVPLTTPVQWLAFTAPAVPAMGGAVFLLSPKASPAEVPATVVVGAPKAPAAPPVRDSVLTNGVVSLTFSAATGLLTTFSNPAAGINGAAFSQAFLWWNSSTGNYHNDGTGDWGQSSGAYIFRPNGTEPFPVAGGAVNLTILSSGPVVWEALQQFAPWATQVVRLWAGSAEVEFEWTVGPVPIADGLGKEVISRFSTVLATNGTWKSDANGRDLLVRRRNQRESFNLTVWEPIAGNYVPANLAQQASDVTTGVALSVVTDRTQAASSIVDGSLEFMVHRRILADDSRGVGEPLNETGLNGNGLIVRGVHRVMLSPPSTAGADVRGMMGASLFRPELRIAPTTLGSSYTANFSALSAPLPPQLGVVTVHAQGPSTVLLRVAHMFGVGEDDVLSKPASVDLATLFTGFRVLAATEMTLPGTIPLTEAPVTTYTTTDGASVTLPVVPPAPAGPGLTITLGPMQVRTFRCQVAYN